MDFEPYFKVHNLVSVYRRSLVLGQMTNLNMIFHVVVSVYRLVKIWNSPQVPDESRNGQRDHLFKIFFSWFRWKKLPQWATKENEKKNSRTAHKPLIYCDEAYLRIISSLQGSNRSKITFCILTNVLTSTHSATYSLTRARTHARTHALTHSRTHSLTHSLTHSGQHCSLRLFSTISHVYTLLF